MALNDTAIKNAKPLEKQYRMTDYDGLYLLVRPDGKKWWRQDYRFAGKDKTLSLGIYPEISLKVARERRDEIRRQVAEGVDPSAFRKHSKQFRIDSTKNSFKSIALEWYLKKEQGWSKRHAQRILNSFENNIFPWIGKQPIYEIKASELLKPLREIEKRNIDLAHKTLQACGQVFRYAIATDRAEQDIASSLREALLPNSRGHHPAIIDPKGVGALLRAIDGFTGTLVVKTALQLAPLVFVRPGELRGARWADIDLENGEWKYFVGKTKTDHLVPLSKQAIALLNNLYPLTGHQEWVFPGTRKRNKPISDGTLNAALQRLGYNTKKEMTGHGFRAMARTLIHEKLRFEPEVIEHQLAHTVPDPLGTAYNRTKFIEVRRIMMQRWADYLDELKVSKGS